MLFGSRESAEWKLTNKFSLILPSLNNTDADGIRQSKKALFYGSWQKNAVWVFAALLILMLAPQAARAGIMSFVSDILVNKQGSVLKADTVQNMALLEAFNNPDFANSIDTQIVDSSSLLANSGPAGGAADVASSTPATGDKISVYAVRSGDTLSGIANMFGVSVNTVMWANDLKKGASIKEGDTLVILPINGIKYTVKKGDTLSSIAKKYGGDGEGIMAFNNLDSDKGLQAGDEIIIPDGEATAPSTAVPAKGGKNPAVDSRPNYAGYYAWPVKGGRKSQGMHGNNGIDIAAPSGTSALAAAGGSVILARDGGYNGGYGSYVVIKHPNGTQTLYAHLSSVSVSSGQTVEKGQTIGGVGNTGRSTGNHLHFEVRGAKNPF